jgi:hypothetical protein
MHIRSITTLCLFALAAVVALKYPMAGLGICICCLIVYFRPDPPAGCQERLMLIGTAPAAGPDSRVPRSRRPAAVAQTHA